jgi:thermitase
MRTLNLNRLSLSLMLCCFVSLLPGRALARQQADYVPGEVLVGLRTDIAPAEAAAAFAGDIGLVVGRQPALNAMRVRLRHGLSVQEAIARLRRMPGVLYAEPNHILRAVSTPNDTYYSLQYALPKIQASQSWDFWTPRAQAIVAILDTGADYTHPDLNPVLLKDANGVVIGYNTLTGTNDARDDHYHGTHVAGIAAARINNATGVAGVAGWNPGLPDSGSWVRIMPVKVLDSTGSGTDASVADGILWAAAHGARVLNMSLGGTSSSTTLANAVQSAWTDYNCVVVAAAGNNGSSALFYPAAYPNVISVAATDSADKLTSFTNYGSWVKTAAPGYNIYSTRPGGTYVYLSGTSMAAPHVAGEAGAILAQNPSLSNSEVSSLIVSNVDPYTPYAGRTLAAGAGRINVLRAVLAAGNGSPGLAGVALNTYTILGGTATAGTVYLGAPAEADTPVTLTSGNPAVVVLPPNVTVFAGDTTATFTVTTNPVAATTAVTISATDGVRTESALLTVLPVRVASVGITPNPVGLLAGTALGTVKTNAAAPPNGLIVSLSSSNPAVATVPASILVPPGSSSQTFTVTLVGAGSTTIRATGGGATVSTTLTVRSGYPQLTALSLSPTSVYGGYNVAGTVTLSFAALPGGTSVALSSTNPAAHPPAGNTVLVPEGKTSATFIVTTDVAISSALTGAITATCGVSRSVGLTVNPIKATAVYTNPSTSVKLSAGTALGRVYIAVNAPPGGVPVTLSSTTGIVTFSVNGVPTNTVTVPQGTNNAAFTINLVAAGTTTIRATAGGVTVSRSLTVTP